MKGIDGQERNKKVFYRIIQKTKKRKSMSKLDEEIDRKVKSQIYLISRSYYIFIIRLTYFSKSYEINIKYEINLEKYICVCVCACKNTRNDIGSR